MAQRQCLLCQYFDFYSFASWILVCPDLLSGPVCKFVAAFVFELPQASSFPAMDIVRDMHCSFRSVERTTNDLVHCCLQFLRGLCVIYRNTSMQYTSCIISGTYFWLKTKSVRRSCHDCYVKIRLKKHIWQNVHIIHILHCRLRSAALVSYSFYVWMVIMRGRIMHAPPQFLFFFSQTTRLLGSFIMHMKTLYCHYCH